MSEPVDFSAACHACRRRGVPMTWWMPVETDEKARAYCRRKACKAERDAWERRLMIGRRYIHWTTEPVTPGWLRPMIEWGRSGKFPRQDLDR